MIWQATSAAARRLNVDCGPRHADGWINSRHPEIVRLDNRERESLFVEATR
jgi:hypothetical protein